MRLVEHCLGSCVEHTYLLFALLLPFEMKDGTSEQYIWLAYDPGVVVLQRSTVVRCAVAFKVNGSSTGGRYSWLPQGDLRMPLFKNRLN
jgi:hypothetical protein